MAANRPSADSPLPPADRQRSTPVFDLIGGTITDSDGPPVAPARSRFGPRSAFVCIHTAMPQTDGKALPEGLWYLASNPVGGVRRSQDGSTPSAFRPKAFQQSGVCFLLDSFFRTIQSFPQSVTGLA